MTRRSMPPRFKAPCSLWRAFADFCSTCGVDGVANLGWGSFSCPQSSHWGRSCLTSRLRTSPATTGSPTARPRFCVWLYWANRTKRSLTSYSLPWAPSRPTSSTSWSKLSSKTARRSSSTSESANLPKRDRFILASFIWANANRRGEVVSLRGGFWFMISFASICNA